MVDYFCGEPEYDKWSILVAEWDASDMGSMLISYIRNDLNAVKIANYIRNLGYTVELEKCTVATIENFLNVPLHRIIKIKK